MTMWDILTILKDIQIMQLIAIGIILWYFLGGLKAELKAEMKDIRMSIDALDRDLRKMNTRVSRIEGIVYGQRSPYIAPIDEA